MNSQHSSKEIAAAIDASTACWVVLWSPYHQCYTAIAACTPDKVILDHPNPSTLLAWMRDVELAAARAAITARTA